MDPSFRIYVADWVNSRIVRTNDMDGAGWRTLGMRKGDGPNEFDLPEAIFAEGGRIFVADTLDDRIVRMNDIRGEGWTTGTQEAVGSINFDAPRGLFVDSKGRIHVGVPGRSRKYVIE